MIFLFTRLKDDTTIKVIQWLKSIGKEFYRFNTIADLKHFINGDTSNEGLAAKISSVYFNGGSVIVPRLAIQDSQVEAQVRDYLKAEGEVLLEHILEGADIHKTFGLSPFANTRINKLNVLLAAKKIGFNTPETAVVTSKQQIKKLLQSWGRIINKSIGDGVNVNTEEWIINGQMTEEITIMQVEKMPNHFFPSLIQRLIEKKYEVRVFYFNGYIKSIAIFSQLSKGTNIDWRNSQTKAPNRQIPYTIPERVVRMVNDLMAKLQLNYGSIDFIVTPELEFYFLEVNPYGQYGFLSTAGNYYIEKYIALNL